MVARAAAGPRSAPLDVEEQADRSLTARPGGYATYGSYGGNSLWPAAADPDDKRPPGFSEHSILRTGGQAYDPRDRHQSPNAVNMCELILAPWVLLALILGCFFLGGANGQPVVLGIMPLVLLVLCGAFIRWHYKRGNNAEVVLGLLCFAAIVTGLFVGLFAIFRYLQEYHRLSQGASYFNVFPNELAAGKSDATTISFTSDTAVDQNTTYGYLDVRSLATYCVAPVSDGIKLGDGNIQYWAAGVNCCEPRGKFTCGAASDRKAHAAFVLPTAWKDHPGFSAAVKGAEAAYGVKSGSKYLLVQWAQDPVGYRNRLWTSAGMLFIIFGSVYLLISLMIGCALLPALAPK